MSSRKPATSTGILANSIHGGHTIGNNGIGDDPSTITRYGSAEGVFRIELSNQAGTIADFQPFLDIEITEIKCIRNNTADGTPAVQVYNVSRLGVETEITDTFALTIATGAVDVANRLKESRLVKAKSDGQSIRVKAPGGITGGGTMYISFLNRSTLPTP